MKPLALRASVPALLAVLLTPILLLGCGKSGTPGTSYRFGVMADNPRGYWRLGETSGKAVADETSKDPGSYENGVRRGISSPTNDANRAASFDGVDDQISMGDPASGALDFGIHDFSFEAWVRTAVNGEQTVASKQGDSGPYWQVTVTDDYGATGRIRARIDGGTVMREAYGPAVNVDDGGWHHVVVLFDRRAGITIYVDKTYVRSTPGAMTDSVSNSADFLIGGETAFSFPAFKGEIDDVAVYPDLLSPERIRAHYENAVAPDHTAPVVAISAPLQNASIADATPALSGKTGLAPGDSSVVRVGIHSGSKVADKPVRTIETIRDSSGAWLAEASPGLSAGKYTAQAEQADAAGNTGTSKPVSFAIAQPPSPASGDPVLLAAGDIADCGASGDDATAALLHGLPGRVATLGDNAYPSGTDAEFADCYGPTWGREKARTRPAVGDHDYETPHAEGYFRYFGSAAGDPGKGYYSYRLGAWNVIVLNSNCGEIGGCQRGSAQERWLRADLDRHRAPCTLSYFGSPLFSSGSRVGDNLEMRPLWQALHDGGADIVLTGDDHDYERFAPQSPAGKLDLAHGISQFVVGTGGESHYAFPVGVPAPNSQVRNDKTFGILRLQLHSNGYDWKFIPVAEKTFTDSGSRSCK